MQANCTCGAQLPQDARFCHRCGKPQREEIQIQPEAVAVEQFTAPTASAPPPVTPAHVTFGNPLALRTSFLIASITTVLDMLPYIGLIAPVLAGFAAVSFYNRRAGVALNLREGAKLAWLTAVFNAILLTIFSSLSIGLLGTVDFDGIREQFKHQAVSPAQQQMMNAPWFMAFVVLFAWLMLFAISSVLHMAGGALAARFSRTARS